MIPSDYQTEPGFDPAEDHIGPFYFRKSNGPMDCAFYTEVKHCNTNGTVHGGVLMTFADYALCMAATNGYDGESCVTVSFSSEFLAGAELGKLVSCIPKVNRVTGSMVFVTGEVQCQGEICLTFSAVVKRLRS
ncbi:MAG: acyl-coenzyme A thioesterase 13 [Candidatus Azotimanducaceae bacterium]|jgi:acyl-coenzyme A thioesterase 13